MKARNSWNFERENSINESKGASVKDHHTGRWVGTLGVPEAFRATEQDTMPDASRNHNCDRHQKGHDCEELQDKVANRRLLSLRPVLSQEEHKPKHEGKDRQNYEASAYFDQFRLWDRLSLLVQGGEETEKEHSLSCVLEE